MKRFAFNSLIALSTRFSASLLNFSPNFSSNQVIINIDGLSVPEEFKIVDAWIKMTFDSPFEIIKCEVDNEFIKISNTVDNFKTIAISDTDQNSLFAYTFSITLPCLIALKITGSFSSERSMVFA